MYDDLENGDFIDTAVMFKDKANCDRIINIVIEMIQQDDLEMDMDVNTIGGTKFRRVYYNNKENGKNKVHDV